MSLYIKHQLAHQMLCKMSRDTYHKVTTSLLYVFVGIDLARAKPVSIHTQHTHKQLFYGSLDFVRDKLGEPVLEETFTYSHLSWSSIIPYLLHPWHPHCSTDVPDRLLPQSLYQVFFGLPPGLAPSTLHSIHFFTQSLSSLCSTCPYHHNLFRCSTEIMSSNPSLSLNPLLGTLFCSLTPHSQKTILISAH